MFKCNQKWASLFVVFISYNLLLANNKKLAYFKGYVGLIFSHMKFAGKDTPESLIWYIHYMKKMFLD